MQAICVTPARGLEVRTIPTPAEAAPGHVLVAMDSSAINHGDKTFLKMPSVAGSGAVTERRDDVWGASGAGRVTAVGAGVPDRYLGKQVAVYRSLGRTSASVGLWCATAQVPWSSCLVLPETVQARDYCGSLVNVITGYAFLDEIVEAGHRGVIVTAGNSATGHALASLARRRGMPAIFLVRTEAARATLSQMGAEHVIVTSPGYTDALAALAAELTATAVFDGVGGTLLGEIVPVLPMNTTIYVYGFLGGPAPVPLPTMTVMLKTLTIRRFSNFESRTVREPDRLSAALTALEAIIDDPMFATRIGQTFGVDEIEQAMAYASPEGAKAVLLL